MSANNPPGLLDTLFRTDAVREIFSDYGRLQGMLDFEAALARATARAGVIPSPAASQRRSRICAPRAIRFGLSTAPARRSPRRWNAAASSFTSSADGA